MAKTDVILIKNVVGLGGESDQIKVAAGYARNYLIPHGIAIPVTSANKRRLEVLKQRRAERESNELQAMSELAKSIVKLICVVKVKTGEDGKMFGAVTAGQIADELHRHFEITLDRKKIHVDHHGLRSLGDHELNLNLHPEVKATLKVRIESLTPPPAPVVEAAPKTEEAKPSKGGKGRAERTERKMS